MIVRLAEAARDDLMDIWRYIAGESVAAAERQLERLEAAIKRLADFPDIGLARGDLGKDLRMLRIDRYAVFYRRRDRRMIVERILHASRDTDSIRF